jgi:hypothetical protein
MRATLSFSPSARGREGTLPVAQPESTVAAAEPNKKLLLFSFICFILFLILKLKVRIRIKAP